MSQETIQSLNTNTLIGMTDKRGKAWHYRAEEQGDESNHYPGAIPLEDIRRRLFHWQPEEFEFLALPDVDQVLKLARELADADTADPEAVKLLTGMLLAGVYDHERKAIIRPDLRTILGVFKSGYKIHEYDEWLVKNVETLLDDDLICTSAGLLVRGAVAWVEISVPENITTPEGVEFRPNLLAATSLNGWMSSTYQRAVQETVCDNTMAAALREPGQKIRIKHSRNSLGRIDEAREALAIVHTIADEFAAEVAQLTNTTVSEGDWAKFLDELTPLPEEAGRSRTMSLNKRAELNHLWLADPRVSPWRGTAFGVVQAVNTHTHHEKTVKGAERAERNMLRAVTGGVDKLDADTLRTLEMVLAS